MFKSAEIDLTTDYVLLKTLISASLPADSAPWYNLCNSLRIVGDEDNGLARVLITHDPNGDPYKGLLAEEDVLIQDGGGRNSISLIDKWLAVSVGTGKAQVYITTT